MLPSPDYTRPLFVARLLARLATTGGVRRAGRTPRRRGGPLEEKPAMTHPCRRCDGFMMPLTLTDYESAASVLAQYCLNCGWIEDPAMHLNRAAHALALAWGTTDRLRDRRGQAR